LTGTRNAPMTDANEIPKVAPVEILPVADSPSWKAPLEMVGACREED
jgi:hypothetical protein